MVFFFCFPFSFDLCRNLWPWLKELTGHFVHTTWTAQHFRSSFSLRTDKPGWNLTFFRFLIAHAQLATLSTLTHAWLRQKYFFWIDEKNVPTTKCTYLLTKLSRRWGEMLFPVSPNQIIFFIFLSFFFKFPEPGGTATPSWKGLLCIRFLVFKTTLAHRRRLRVKLLSS